MKSGAIRIGTMGAGVLCLFARQHFTWTPGTGWWPCAGTLRNAAFATAIQSDFLL